MDAVFTVGLNNRRQRGTSHPVPENTFLQLLCVCFFGQFQDITWYQHILDVPFTLISDKNN